MKNPVGVVFAISVLLLAGAGAQKTQKSQSRMHPQLTAFHEDDTDQKCIDGPCPMPWWPWDRPTTKTTR